MAQGRSPRPVVVGVDGSDAALAAARFALDEAWRRSAPLLVVTAVPWPYDGLVGEPLDIELPGLLRTSAQSVLQAAMKALAPIDDDVPVRTRVVDGDPVTVLRDASEDAQLVVLGSRGVGGVAGLLLGSTASRVVAHAGCPVIVLPGDCGVQVSERRSVVVGIEGRQGDDDVLAFAFAEAAARGADLLAVHVWQEVVLDASLRTVGPLIDWSGVVTDEERGLAEVLAGWRAKEPDVVVREAVIRDRTAPALVAASMTAQLLVVGHRARHAPGSTTHGVLNRGRCPIAVVPLATGGAR
ncbi:MAG: UspA protein [Blastococcus sp.]|jgi:nucleotide-binding universal stress UspA family protein|nr:UspA protein [Blastococcus sp.]